MPKPTDMSEKAIARRARYKQRIESDAEFAERRRQYSRDHNDRHVEERRASARETMARWRSNPENLEKLRLYGIEYRKNNAEELRAKNREKHARNREERNAQMRAYREKNPEMFRAKADRARQASRLRHPCKEVFKSARQRSKKAGYDFDLTLEYLNSIWTGVCAISGLPMIVGLRGQGPQFFSPSLDRIDPKKGYTKGNVRFVLMAVNAFKFNGSDEDMYKVAVAIVKNYRPKVSPCVV